MKNKMYEYIKCKLEFFINKTNLDSYKVIYNFVKICIDMPEIDMNKHYKLLFKESIMIENNLGDYFDFYLYDINSEKEIKFTLSSFNIDSSLIVNNEHLDLSECMLIYKYTNILVTNIIYGIYVIDYYNDFMYDNEYNPGKYLYLIYFIIKHSKNMLQKTRCLKIDCQKFKLTKLPKVVLCNIFKYFKKYDLLIFRLINKECLEIFKKCTFDPIIINIHGIYTSERINNILICKLNNLFNLIQKYNIHKIPKFLLDINIRDNYIHYFQEPPDYDYLSLKSGLKKLSPYIYSLFIKIFYIMTDEYITDILNRCINLKYLHVPNYQILNIINKILIFQGTNNLDINISLNLEWENNTFLDIKSNIISNIKILKFGLNNISNIEVLTQFNNLEELELYGNPKSNDDNIIIEYVSKLKNIKKLFFYWDIKITKDLLLKLPNLYTLFVGNINKDIYEFLLENKNIKYLILEEGISNVEYTIKELSVVKDLDIYHISDTNYYLLQL